MEALLYNYKEIISIIDFDFQILIRNSEFNVDKYIQKITKNIKEENIKKSELFNKYIANLKVNLEKEKMYDMSYYIIVIDTGKINFLETVDNTFKKFKKLGCEAIRISNKTEISDILNYFINREKEVLANEF